MTVVKSPHRVNYYVKNTSLTLFAFYQELWNGDVEVHLKTIFGQSGRNF